MGRVGSKVLYCSYFDSSTTTVDRRKLGFKQSTIYLQHLRASLELPFLYLQISVSN